MDADFIQERITKTKEQIVAWEDASTALAGGAQSYTIDTGQNRTTVTRSDLSQIQATLDTLYNRCATLEARLNGSGTLTARPCW
jgi:hypothetical protein